jgi:hypothetical protein
MLTDEDYVLEAHAYYLNSPPLGIGSITAPSAHIVGGQVAEGITLQMLEGNVWRGNVFVDLDTVDDFGVSSSEFEIITRSMQEMVYAFRGLGLVKGGIDFAVARVGGKFGSETLVGMQDLNLSSHGAEYLRAFLQKARDDLGSDLPIYGAAKVIVPSRATDLGALSRRFDRTEGRVYTRAISSVPGRWGLVAAANSSPRESLRILESLEESLRLEGYLDTTKSK